MEISSCIDWLSITFAPQENAAKFILAIKDYGNNTEHKPQFGYDTAIKYEIGLVVMWSQGRDDMGTHVVLSGSTLEALAVAGNDIRALLALAIELHGKTTRLDLAIDARNADCDINAMYYSAKAGLSKGSAQSINIITGTDDSATLYIGSRQSDKFARLYDKGIQAKIGGDWKRLEVELKGDVAKEYARYVAFNPDKSIASLCWGIAKKMFYTEVGNYPIFGTDSQLVSMPKIEKKTDVEKWLSTQILPIIEKFVKTHPTSTIYDELIQCLINAKKNSKQS